MGRGIWAAMAVSAALLSACNNGEQAATDGAAAGEGGAVTMVRDEAAGKPFGSAGPRKCPSKKEPASGAPSAAQAAAYATCALEGQMSDMMYLVDQVTVTDMGKPRAYNPLEDINMSNIDIERPVHPIRGNYNKFQCGYLEGQGGGYKRGANCTMTAQPSASGLCYADTFGDWHCSMVDVDAPYGTRREVAPPA